MLMRDLYLLLSCLGQTDLECPSVKHPSKELSTHCALISVKTSGVFWCAGSWRWVHQGRAAKWKRQTRPAQRTSSVVTDWGTWRLWWKIGLRKTYRREGR